MSIIVTGGAGMIGSNIVQGLNQSGRDDIIVIDDLKDGKKFWNISDLNISDYLDKNDYLAMVKDGKDLGKINAIITKVPAP
jgi:ADP-L-glycero-D-manno-heptose 6-epimerase